MVKEENRPAIGRAGLLYWLCQLLGWGLYVVVTIYEFRELDPDSMGARLFVEPLVSATIGIGLTHGLRRIAKVGGWVRLQGWRFIRRLAAALLVVTTAHVGALAVIELGIYGDRPSSAVLMIVFALMRWAMVFCIWFGIYFGVGVFRERQRALVEQLKLERSLQAAELRSLKSQLNPHFLFNSLNSVRALIADDPAAAQTAVTQLARTMRYTLSVGKEDTVQLEQELAMVDDYLGLESLRLAERLRVERTIAADVATARVPVMLLQILVENAIKHGIAHLPKGGVLRMSAERVDGALVLRVENARPATRPTGLDESNGVALANVTERLRLLFGSEARLELDLSRPEHATAVARIPQV